MKNMKFRVSNLRKSQLLAAIEEANLTTIQRKIVMELNAEGLASDLKEQIAAMGKFEMDIPIFGKYAFSPDDVDTLLKYIKEAKR